MNIESRTKLDLPKVRNTIHSSRLRYRREAPEAEARASHAVTFAQNNEEDGSSQDFRALKSVINPAFGGKSN